MREGLFTSATLKLTAWYLVILMTVSVMFSVVLFAVSTSEFRHSLRAPDGPGPGRLWRDDGAARELRQERFEELQQNLAGRIALFNTSVLAFGGLASYFLARRTLQPIQEALDAQARFNSDAAHELRTPLAVMQSEMEVALRDKNTSKETYKQTLQSSLDEVDRLQTLTERLLLLASSEKLSLAPVEVENVVIDVVNRIIPLAQKKHIAIENTVGRATVFANEEALIDVMTVLLDNAVKYSPKRSLITISLKQHEKSVTILVADQGRGIDESDRKRIFERFYRSDVSRSKQHVEGHGLGLSIAQRLVSEQQGTLCVVPNKKAGSVFSVTLKRA